MVSCVGLTAAAWPALSNAQLAVCARIADPAARLACYDELAGAERARGAGVPQPASKAPHAPAAADRVALRASVMEERWELRPELKRGTFNLLPYRPVYGLVHWTTDANTQPASPTRPFDASQPVDLDRAEGKFQLSFKTKAAEGLFGTRGDLWLGYTQVSYWQVGNRRHSSPFRETNYEPEATLLFPLNVGLGGLDVRFAGLTLNHQSNGRGGTLSRSWNRLIGEVGAEYGPWSLHARPWARVFKSSGQDDDNPDIEDYAGRGELAVSWRGRGHVVTTTLRHSLRSGDRSRARRGWIGRFRWSVRSMHTCRSSAGTA